MDREQEILDLINDNQKLIWNICRTFYLDQENREDLFQEIVFKILKSFKGFRRESKFSTWVYRIGINTAITYKRKESRYKNHLSNLQVADFKFDDNLDEEIIILYRSIEKLNKIEKAIILLYLEEKSYEEISEIMGFSPKNIGVKIVRIKKKLEQIYLSFI